MLSIKEQNKEILSNYNTMTSIIIGGLIDLEKEKINFISFEPFEDLEIKRYHNEYEAYQKVETKDGFNFYIEPSGVYPENRMIFIKDIEEKKIKKGDTGRIYRINGINSNRNSAEFEIALEDYRTVSVESNSCVFDTNYKYLYIAKIPVAGQKQFSNSNSDYSKDESHFADAEHSILCAIRVKGNINKDLVNQAQEFFYKINPGAKKLEEDGKYAYLILDSLPSSSKSKELKNDSYRPHKKTYDLNLSVDLKVKLKIK